MKLLTILCALALMLMAYPTDGNAQEPPNSYIFAGGEFDSGEKVFTTTIGGATRIVGNVWALSRTQIGQYGSLETDLGYFVKPGKLRFGLIAGPNVDWITQENADPIGYIVGASGFVVGYAPKEVGIWVSAKYKFALEKETNYQDGNQFGLWMSYGF